ncbi:phosphatase PAP2 family protein [Algoriphagus aestuariicola]|uniref:Phosphatase PAP2 family protein n=2 Tax=Algoriphagus aestuariicola TaxID=1852016 RepID=A0ABS3BIT0_9BACT|nr:phosphatase PAP2 family protein [Algoriphagus aestuariicola]
MLRSIALLITAVFQPLLMPTLVFGLLLFAVPQATSIPEEFKYRIFFLIVLSTLLIPMVTIIGFHLSGTVKSLHMPEVKDRKLPFTITALYFLLTTWFLQQKTDLDPILWLGMMVICIAVVLLAVVSFFWKISAHMIGLGGLLAVVLVLGRKFPTFEVLYPLLGVLLLCGIVASSRLFLQAHKPTEIYTGLVVGFLVCWLGFNWIWA